MNRASDPAAPRVLPPPSAGHESRPELDLDRLVWDPEYREAMRSWLRPVR